VVNELIRAIAKAIKNEFPQCDIFTEELEQGFESPCFFIFCEGQREYNKLDVRFLAEHTFVISYFPKGGNNDCWEVQSKLQRLLELIALDDDSLVRGTNRNGVIKQGVLHFFVNYDCFVYKVEEQTAMEEISENVTVKG